MHFVSNKVSLTDVGASHPDTHLLDNILHLAEYAIVRWNIEKEMFKNYLQHFYIVSSIFFLPFFWLNVKNDDFLKTSLKAQTE